jgi:hypothetical protein
VIIIPCYQTEIKVAKASKSVKADAKMRDQTELATSPPPSRKAEFQTLVQIGTVSQGLKVSMEWQCDSRIFGPVELALVPMRNDRAG